LYKDVAPAGSYLSSDSHPTGSEIARGLIQHLGELSPIAPGDQIEGRERKKEAGWRLRLLSVEQLAMQQQALTNEDPSASAWLTASPAWPENRMNDVAFRTAFQLRNLIPVITEKWCHCRKETDFLSSHIYVCSKGTRIHRKVCELSNAFRQVLPEGGDDADYGEPACADYLQLGEGVQPLFFFAVETSGGMGKEARDFV
jgi:hypothetical protein